MLWLERVKTEGRAGRLMELGLRIGRITNVEQLWH